MIKMFLKVSVYANQVLKKEQGDVPGWVLVTVMTAGLVTALWLVADGQLSNVLNRAISQVAG